MMLETLLFLGKSGFLSQLGESGKANDFQPIETYFAVLILLKAPRLSSNFSSWKRLTTKN
jgi:hypothetical protein